MKFKKHIFICTNDRGEESVRKSCGSCGGMDLRKELVKMINDKGLKGKIRANKSGCLDVCEHGPALVVYPAGHWYLGVEKKDLKRILFCLTLKARYRKMLKFFLKKFQPEKKHNLAMIL